FGSRCESINPCSIDPFLRTDAFLYASSYRHPQFVVAPSSTSLFAFKIDTPCIPGFRSGEPMNWVSTGFFGIRQTLIYFGIVLIRNSISYFPRK
ncbi:MAG: hypothetical protein VX298_01855, partial [Pseudomonadota bacterium]|nr:hypothetical protein [Pseudomonadota bacterium]